MDSPILILVIALLFALTIESQRVSSYRHPPESPTPPSLASPPPFPRPDPPPPPRKPPAHKLIKNLGPPPPFPRPDPPPPPRKPPAHKLNKNLGPPPPFPRPDPPPPPRKPPAHKLNKNLGPPPQKGKTNKAKKIGLMFVGVASLLQVCIVAFLLISRRQLLKAQIGYQRN